MTFILFASGYAQSNEDVFGSTYELVTGYSQVPQDGIYLIAGYLSEKSGGNPTSDTFGRFERLHIELHQG